MLRSPSSCPIYHALNAVRICCYSDSRLKIVAFRNARDLSEMGKVQDAVFQHEFKIIEDVRHSPMSVVQVNFNKSKPFKVHPSSIKTISSMVLGALHWLNLRLHTVAGRERFSLDFFTSSRLHRSSLKCVAVLSRFNINIQIKSFMFTFKVLPSSYCQARNRYDKVGA